VIKQAVVALATSLAFVSAVDAATYELPSPLSATQQSLEIAVAGQGAFTDIINFKVDTRGVATFSTAREKSTSDFLITVFDSTNHLLFGANNYVLGALQAGSYYANVTGFFKGKNNEYTFTALSAAVPLPAAIWLLGGGLIGFLFVARRKNNAVAG
jgi:PEP-CTERM motif